MLGIVIILTISLSLLAVVISESNFGEVNEIDTGPHYKVWCLGNCKQDVQTITQPGAILIGGGSDPDEAFEWQIRNANGGDYLILSAADYGDEYNDYVFKLSVASGHPVNSVTTIQVFDKLASYQVKVLEAIRNAEAIFLEGGDQSRYMNWWVNTPVQTLLQSKIDGNVTIGGTSAGLAVLGNWVYSAQYDSIESEEALLNPYDYRVTIENALVHIPYLGTVITDTHFNERDRMGRMLTFLARILKDNSDDKVPLARAVGVDEPAGLILNVTSGAATAVGSGNIYLCSSSKDPTICSAESPLTFEDVSCVRISADNRETFSFSTWSGSSSESVSYVNDIVIGNFLSDAYGF